MKMYNLSMDEVQLIVLGSLYNGIVSDPECCITTLDVKKYLREIRNANITQAVVSKALEDFYNWFKAEDFVLDVNDTQYSLECRTVRKSGKNYREYYLEEVDVDQADADDDMTDADIIKAVILSNPSKTSAQVRDQLIRDFRTVITIPTVQTIAAYKANLTRRK